jgi:hypothetical protein
MTKSILHYNDLSNEMRAFLGARQILRALGYSADDLYCVVANNVHNRLTVFCVLRTGDKEFSIECASTTSVENVTEEYLVICDALIPEDDITRIVEESEAYKYKVALLMALRAKGIPLPSTVGMLQ